MARVYVLVQHCCAAHTPYSRGQVSHSCFQRQTERKRDEATGARYYVNGRASRLVKKIRIIAQQRPSHSTTSQTNGGRVSRYAVAYAIHSRIHTSQHQTHGLWLLIQLPSHKFDKSFAISSHHATSFKRKTKPKGPFPQAAFLLYPS